MHIIYSNESFAPQFDGVAVCMQNYAKIVNEKYGKSYVLIPAHEDRNEADFDYELLQCPSSNIKLASQYKPCLPMPLKLKNRVDAIPADLLHSHCPFITGLLAMRIAKQMNVPHISTFHSKFKDDVNLRLKMNVDLPGEVVAKYVASFYDKCDYVWTVNHGTANTLKEYGYKGDITIMPNGCDMPITQKDESIRLEICHKYGLNPDVPLLLFVGRLTFLKNVDLIVEALAALNRRGKKFNMLFVGAGEHADKLESMVKEFSLRDKVKFAGKVLDRQELKNIYSSSDLFVFPSIYDNAPLVVREAAACGVPSLLLKGSNSAEGVTDGENGILAEERVEDIALAINDAVSHANLREIGDKARNTIYISWDDVIKKAMAEYERVVVDFNNKPKPKSRFKSFYDIDLEKDFNLSITRKIKAMFSKQPTYRA
jgi:glycosyltransferase involved in cell wall biosynthesis